MNDKIRNAKNKLVRDVIKDVKDNPKGFYSYINIAKKTRPEIRPLKRDDGEIVVDNKEQAEILNKYYASVFTKSKKSVPMINKRTVPELTDIAITKKDVLESLGEIRDSSASGPDGISTKLILEMKEELAKPLTILFRKSLQEARIPDEWRDAVITHIYKKGRKTETGNYRPVSLTSVFGKTGKNRQKTTGT